MYTLEIIATFLNIKSSKIRINNTNLNYIEGFHIIKKAWEVVNENQLYVIESMAAFDELLQKEANFIMFYDSSAEIWKKMGKYANVLILPTSVECDDVRKKLEAFFRGAYKTAEVVPQFASEVIFGNKISKYLASIEQSVGNPMAFLDSELHTIAVSSENYSEVSMRTLFDHRKIETEKIYQWKEKSFPELQVQLEFPMLVSEPFAIRRIFSRLILGGNIYFLECAEYTKKFEDSDLAFLYYVSNILEQFLPTRDSIWGTDKTIEGFFERIVMDSESDVKYMKRQAYALRFPKEGITWRMMLFTNQKFSSYEESTIYIRKLRSLTDAIVFYYRYNIIMIIEDTKVQKFTEELVLKNEEKYFCCVSLPYSEVKYLKEAYEQCSYIYEKIDENTKCMILPYEKFMLSHFYKNVLKSSFETEPFILPIIKIIFKYDKDNKTNYIQILYQYILNFRNIDKTAEDLHIHRNTVIYRLGKVTELFGIDMNNYHVLHNLKNSIEILRAKHD